MTPALAFLKVGVDRAFNDFQKSSKTIKSLFDLSKNNCKGAKMSRQDTKKIAQYYDSIEYHKKARDFAWKMKLRRLSKIREVISRENCVLELGCSSSVYSNDFDDWIGLDISKTVLAINKNKNAVQASVSKLPFRERCFSLVMMFNVIEHLRSPEGALLEALRVLEHDGFLALGSPALIWELLLTEEPSGYKRKEKMRKICRKPSIILMLKHLIPILRKFYSRLNDELLVLMGRKMLPLNPVFLEPDYSRVGEDYDATYAYDPNAVVNFLRSRGLKILDLRPMPTRIFRFPTSDVEIILARKIGKKPR